MPASVEAVKNGFNRVGAGRREEPATTLRSSAGRVAVRHPKPPQKWLRKYRETAASDQVALIPVCLVSCSMLSSKSILVEFAGNQPFRLIRIAACVLLFSASAFAGDWPMFGHDPQRSGWAIEENTLSPDNVSTLKLQWKTKVNNQFYSLSALTAPVVMARVPTAKAERSVVYVAGIAGTVFALDARTGEVVWTRTLRSMATPRKAGLQGTFLCPNGITATPLADEKTGLLYVIAADGALYGLDLATGISNMAPCLWWRHLPRAGA